MKTLLTIIVTLVLAGGLTAFIGARWNNRTGETNAVQVRVEPVRRGELVEIVSAPGQVQPERKVSISARVAARIVELPYEEGDSVTRGDFSADPPVPASVLVRLDSKDLEAQLRAAQARYAAQEAQITVAEARIAAQEAQIASAAVGLKDAQRDLKRQTELLASKDVSQSIVDQAQVKVEQLEAQLQAVIREMEANRTHLTVMRHELDAAEAEIERVRDNLSYTTILSPIDGVVTRLNAQVGELVVTGTMNNPGTVIMEVADLSRMLVNARVDESHISQVQIGQPVKVRTQAYPDRVFDATVQSVALAHTDETGGARYYKTEILLHTDGQRIFSGLSADVEIETQRHADVLKVPSQAVLGRAIDDLPQDLRTRPEVDQTKTFATVVYQIQDGKAVATPVRIGPSDMTHTIIRSGLNEGDSIITGPYKVLEALKHGDAVKLETPTTPSPSGRGPG